MLTRHKAKMCLTFMTSSMPAFESDPRILYASSKFICLVAFAACLRLSGVIPLLCPSTVSKGCLLRPAMNAVYKIVPRLANLLTTACRHACAAARTMTLPPATIRFAKIREACMQHARLQQVAAGNLTTPTLRESIPWGNHRPACVMQYNKADADTVPGAQKLVARSDLSNFKHADVT